MTRACRPSGYESHQPSRTSHPSNHQLKQLSHFLLFNKSKSDQRVYLIERCIFGSGFINRFSLLKLLKTSTICLNGDISFILVTRSTLLILYKSNSLGIERMSNLFNGYARLKGDKNRYMHRMNIAIIFKKYILFPWASVRKKPEAREYSRH